MLMNMNEKQQITLLHRRTGNRYQGEIPEFECGIICYKQDSVSCHTTQLHLERPSQSCLLLV